MSGYRKNGRALLGSRRLKSRLTTSQTDFRPKTFFPTGPSQHATHPALSKTKHLTMSGWHTVGEVQFFPFCSTNNFSFLRQNAGHLLHQYWREYRWQNVFPWEPELCKLWNKNQIHLHIIVSWILNGWPWIENKWHICAGGLLWLHIWSFRWWHIMAAANFASTYSCSE